MSEKRKRGPKPDRLKIEGDWEDAVDRALQKKPHKGDSGDADKQRVDDTKRRNDSDGRESR